MSVNLHTVKRMAVRHPLPANGHKLVGLRVVVGEFLHNHWRLTHYDAKENRFTITMLTVPAREHSITFDDLRAGYAEGLIRLE